jgi:hypothetical protein
LCLRRSSQALALALGLGLAAASSGADAVLDVSGEVLTTQPRLEVRVLVTNRGDRPAAPVEVKGELLGEESTARLAADLAPGRSAAVVLAFAAAAAPPGVHALTLLLEHALPGAPDAGGNPPLGSQRAWLLVALGASPPAAVSLAPVGTRLAVRGTLEVAVASADHAPHRVLLRALTARGLRVETDPLQLDVPATGSARAAFTLVRSGAARGTRHGVLIVAESREPPPVRTAVAVATVEVAEDSSWLPRARRGLLALGLVLLAVVIVAEILRARSRRREA